MKFDTEDLSLVTIALVEHIIVKHYEMQVPDNGGKDTKADKPHPPH